MDGDLEMHLKQHYEAVDQSFKKVLDTFRHDRPEAERSKACRKMKELLRGHLRALLEGAGGVAQERRADVQKNLENVLRDCCTAKIEKCDATLDEAERLMLDLSMNQAGRDYQRSVDAHLYDK